MLPSDPVRLTIHHSITAPFLRLRGDRNVGIYLPQTFECDMENVPAIVTGTIDQDADGNMGFTALTFTPREGEPFVKREALRNLSFNTILNEAIRKTAFPWDPATGHIHIDQDTEQPAPTTAEDRARLRKTRAAKSAVNPDDAKLQQIAKVYRAGGSRGTEAVRQYLSKQTGEEVHRSTASRLVKAARQKKFLGPALEKRAGEKTRRSKR